MANPMSIESKKRKHQLLTALELLDAQGIKVISSKELRQHVAVKAIEFKQSTTFSTDLDSMAKSSQIVVTKEGKMRKVSLIKNRLATGVVKPMASPDRTSVADIIPVQVKQCGTHVKIILNGYAVSLYPDGNIEQRTMEKV